MRLLATGVAAAFSAVVLLTPGLAQAKWNATGTGGATIGATTMTNASNFKAICASGSSTSGVKLTWTVSPDSFVDGYQIVRTGYGGGTNATFLQARTTYTMNDNPPVGPGISYTYTIQSGSLTIKWVTSLLAATGRPTYSASACTTM